MLFFWAGGDAVKLIYYFVSDDVTIAFKACACFQLSIDLMLLAQTWLYRKQTQKDMEELARLRQDGAAVVGVAGPEAALLAARGEERGHERDSGDEERVVGGGGRR